MKFKKSNRGKTQEEKNLELKQTQEHEKCIACNGSGIYDNTNSPPCSACNGTGSEEILDDSIN